MFTRTFAIAGLLLLGALEAQAEIYRWTDSAGNVHFTQDLTRVPPAKRSAARAEPAAGDTHRVQTYPTVTRSTGREGPRRTGEIRIPFERRRSLMWVDATVNGHLSVPFLIDTGASGVSLPASYVAELGIPVHSKTPRVTVSTANGMVRIPLVEIDSIQLGGAIVENLQATVNPTMEVGLLGGSFFNNFKYSVDAAASVITLAPNEAVRGGTAADEWRARFQTLRYSIDRLETYLDAREVSRAGRRTALEDNLATIREQLQDLEIEANHARVPHSWRH